MQTNDSETLIADNDKKHSSKDHSHTGKTVAVIGGGINGVMTAWALAKRDFSVTLFERDTLMTGTSHTSTKLLHGGLRYLENGEIRLVHESLHERAWWLEQAPHLAHPIEIFLPIYKGISRSRLVLGTGLFLYDLLSGKANLGKRRWHSLAGVVKRFGDARIKTDGLAGAYSFYDAQMDDYQLGIWASEQAINAGVTVREHTEVIRVSMDGQVVVNDGGVVAKDDLVRIKEAADAEYSELQFDHIINVTGPWAAEFLKRSGIPAQHGVDWVRGSHVILRDKIAAGIMMQVPGERRIVFALPYKGHTLLGTTEVRQAITEKIECSEEEESYLLSVYNAYFNAAVTSEDVIDRFAGVRPLLHSTGDASRASREYEIETTGRVTTVFGGKWTTARVLGDKVAEEVNKSLQSTTQSIE